MNKLITLIIVSIFFSTSVSAQVRTLDDAMAINLSGIVTQRLKMTVVAENIANLMTLKDDETGLPYQKKYVSVETGDLGVRVTGVERSTEPFGRYFDPAAPQSDENGYFYIPNVNMPNEMVTIKHTEAMYEANVNAFKLTKTMYQSSIELLK